MNACNSNDNLAVAVDQVVFTSIRSPMGEGYRIVAAGAGIRPDEKTEITQRSPSHDALCKATPGDEALLAYPLASGRFCVGFCCTAGREHTARGGERIYTHYVVLDRDAFARFGFNPFQVASLLRAAVGDALVLKQLPSLPDLKLTAGHSQASGGGGVNGDAVPMLGGAAFSGEAVVVADGASPHGLAAMLFAALPAAIRRRLSVSAGLKFALSRRIQFSFVGPDAGETQRALRGQSIKWIDLSKGAGGGAGGSALPEGWFKFALGRLSAGRHVELATLTAEMLEDAPPEFLERVAALCQDLDAVPTANGETLKRLGARWGTLSAGSGVMSRLLREFQKARDVRLEQLNAEAARETTAGV